MFGSGNCQLLIKNILIFFIYFFRYVWFLDCLIFGCWSLRFLFYGQKNLPELTNFKDQINLLIILLPNFFVFA